MSGDDIPDDEWNDPDSLAENEDSSSAPSVTAVVASISAFALLLYFVRIAEYGSAIHALWALVVLAVVSMLLER